MLPVAGSKVTVTDARNVAPVAPSVTVTVWVRVAHAVDGGSRSVTLPTDVVAPRSTWTHCGKALLALSQ